MMRPVDVNLDHLVIGVAFFTNWFCFCSGFHTGLNCIGHSPTRTGRHIPHSDCTGIGLVPRDNRIATPSGWFECLGITPLPASWAWQIFTARQPTWSPGSVRTLTLLNGLLGRIWQIPPLGNARPLQLSNSFTTSSCITIALNGLRLHLLALLMLLHLTPLHRYATTTLLALFPFLRLTFSLHCVLGRLRKMAMLLLVRRYLHNVKSQSASCKAGCGINRYCKIRPRPA
jgi:hypothetical protein